MQITHCIVLRLLSFQILNYPKLSQQTYSSTILTIPKNELFQDIASNFPKITPSTERNVIVPRFVKLSQNAERTILRIKIIPITHRGWSMQKRNRSKRGRQLLARLDYLGCPGRNGGERERGMQPLSELLTSRHSGALQVHSLNSFSSPSYSSTLPSLSSPRSLTAFPLPSRASRPRPTTTRLLLPKKISPRFRPTFSGGGRGIAKIRLSLNERERVAEAKPNFGLHVRERNGTKRERRNIRVEGRDDPVWTGQVISRRKGLMEGCCVNEERSWAIRIVPILARPPRNGTCRLNAAGWLSALFFVVLIGSISGVLHSPDKGLTMIRDDVVGRFIKNHPAIVKKIVAICITLHHYVITNIIYIYIYYVSNINGQIIKISFKSRNEKKKQGQRHESSSDVINLITRRTSVGGGGGRRGGRRSKKQAAILHLRV